MYGTDPVIVVASGGFDPLHKGHIEYFTEAKKLGDRLIVAVETDNCIIRRHGISFMNWEERIPIIKALKSVDDVMLITDCDNPYTDVLRQLRRIYPTSNIIFASGNSRSVDNTPMLDDQKISFAYEVGADVRVPSSSAVLRRYSEYVKSIKELESSPFRRYE